MIDRGQIEQFRLVDLLEEHYTSYTIMGASAVPVWGIPRATYLRRHSR